VEVAACVAKTVALKIVRRRSQELALADESVGRQKPQSPLSYLSGTFVRVCLAGVIQADRILRLAQIPQIPRVLLACVAAMSLGRWRPSFADETA